jgi:hypothetical protein
MGHRRAGRRAEGGARSEPHHAHPSASQPEQAAGLARDRLAADDHRRGITQDARPQALPEARREPALVGARLLPRSEVEQRRHERDAGHEGHRAARCVIHGAGRAIALGPPRRAERGAAQEDRVDGQRAGAEEAGRRQQPAPHDG